MFIEIAERSVDGGHWLTKCERCGVSLDWVTSLELTMMSVKGLHNLCFDCDPSSNGVHSSLKIDGLLPDHITVVAGGRLIAIDVRSGQSHVVVGYLEGKSMRSVASPYACPVVHISAKPAESGFAESTARTYFRATIADGPCPDVDGEGCFWGWGHE
jgi:hypothetical protein